MNIKNHKLVGVDYDAAKVIGGTIKPKFLVMHYTAGYSLESAQDVFNRTVIAAHLIIDKDGRVLQMVPFNKRANHAGPSIWKGVKSLNNHSIGFEFVNIGWAKKRNDGRLVDSYDRLVPEDEAQHYIKAPESRVGSGDFYWEPFTPEQIEAGKSIVKELLKEYPMITDIVTHQQIDTRGWKTDAGPAFPMNQFIALLRQGENDQEEPVMTGTVTASRLNVRGGPGTSFEVIDKIKSNDTVNILDSRNGWFKIEIEAGFGWVFDDYVDVD